MTIEKPTAKQQFKQSLKEFANELQSYVSTEDGQWSIKGFIDAFKNVYTISADTKIVSKILEIHLFPKLLAFAEKNGLRVVLAECQNWYPDFSLVGVDDPSIKFAVDLKTTYRDLSFPGHVNGFTLGSHGQYFQNRTSKKNIQFPYSEYLGHFCLGTIYTRVVAEELTGMKVYSVKELGSNVERAELQDVQQAHNPTLRAKLREVDRLQAITSVVKDFQFFACEKWELASDHQGSSNTANIGGITWIQDILEGNGLFAKLGEHVFDEYWMNYGQMKVLKDGKSKAITRLRDFLEAKQMDVSLMNRKITKTKGRGASRGSTPESNICTDEE